MSTHMHIHGKHCSCTHQCVINPHSEGQSSALDFGAALQAKPDVILVGEVRDEATFNGWTLCSSASQHPNAPSNNLFD